jgi:hypothetical protein
MPQGNDKIDHARFMPNSLEVGFEVLSGGYEVLYLLGYNAV